MKRWSVLAVAIVIALAAVFVLGTRIGRNEPTAAVPATGAPGVAGGDVHGVPGTSADASLTIDARSIETDAAVGGLRSLRIAGPLNVTLPARRTSGAKDRGSVTVSGTEVTITSAAITLDSTLLIRPNDVSFKAQFGETTIAASGTTTVRGSDISVTFGTTTTTRHGSYTFFADVQDSGIGEQIHTTQPTLRWLDAPTSFRVFDPARTWTSWAGSGGVRVGERTFSNEFGVFAGKNVAGTIRRTAGRIRATAKGIAQQVYLDGAPQFETKATCDLIQIREQSQAGRRIELTWAPRNLGDFDMLMTRLVPVGRQAGWLSLALEPAPHMFGGESRRAIGGQTAGFLPGGAIRSVLPPGDADRRDISVNIPAGTQPGTYDATVRIEGNFKSVTVPFEVTVV